MKHSPHEQKLRLKCLKEALKFHKIPSPLSSTPPSTIIAIAKIYYKFIAGDKADD